MSKPKQQKTYKKQYLSKKKQSRGYKMVYLHTNVYKYAGCNRQSMQTSTTDILAMATQKFSNPTQIKTRKKFTPTVLPWRKARWKAPAHRVRVTKRNFLRTNYCSEKNSKNFSKSLDLRQTSDIIHPIKPNKAKWNQQEIGASLSKGVILSGVDWFDGTVDG